MADAPAGIPIQDRYTQQIAAVLETNREHQADLRKRLGQLEADEKVLSGLLDSAPAPQTPRDTKTTADAAQPAKPDPQDTTPAPAARDEAAVPPPRSEEPGTSAIGPVKTPRKIAVKKTVARPPANEATKKAAADVPAEKVAEPPLGELLLQILAQHPGERFTVAEVATELEQLFPPRARNVKIVRQTLETLLAKMLLERAKQGGTVYYSSLQPESGPAAAEAHTELSPAVEAADTPEGKELEEVPAQA
ncbi:hypothetical protein [Streptomyces sp. NPDC051572]|uniref:hypothetical protein n=1 Tax=Streptomyces sp. NPDC051572 TaxID=3155802 RepID=UPI0034506D16